METDYSDITPEDFFPVLKTFGLFSLNMEDENAKIG